MAVNRQTYTDDGKKTATEKPKTQSVSVGGRSINVPTSTPKTAKQNVTVGGRDIKVDVPTPKYVQNKPATKTVTNPTVGGRTITSKNAPVVSNNVDLTPSIRQNNRIQEPAKPNVQYKQDYTEKDVKKISDDFQDKLINSPFTNPDVEYTGQNYQQFDQDIKNKQAELNVARGKVALNKELQDLNKDGDLNLNDVVQDVNGKTQLIDYTSQIAQKEEENKQLNAELKELESQASSQPLNKIGAINTGNIGTRMKEIRDILNRNEAELSDLTRKSRYQNAVYSQFAYEDAVNKGDTETLMAIADQHASYDDSFIERRLNNIGKTSVDVVSTVVNVAQIGLDLGGEAIANAWAKGAEELKDNGTISDEQFNNMMETVKPLMDYDANSGIGAELRNISAQLSYDIQNGVDTSTIQGKIESFIGQGLDSTVNFLAQYMLFGEAGSLALMSGQSGSEKYFENIEKGYDQTTAFANALATGMTSYFVEKVGMDNFVSILNGQVGNTVFAQAWNAIASGKSPLSFWAGATLSQGLSEGLEEGVEGNIDYLIDLYTSRFEGVEPAEYNAGDIFYGMLVGAFSGALTGSVASFNATVNTRKQYNALKADVDSLISARDEARAKGEDVTLANRAIAVGQSMLSDFEGNSVAMAVDLAEDMVEPNLNEQGVKDSLTTILEPNVNQDIETQTKTTQLINDVMETAQTVLATKGINMDVNEYVDLSPEARINTSQVQEYANKLRANVMFSTSFDGDGFYDPNLKMIVINPNSKLGELSTLVHELTHGTETSGVFYDSLASLVKDNFNGDYNKAIQNIKQYYKSNGVKLNNDGAKREFTAINTQDMLGNEDFVKKLIRYNESMAYRIFSDIRNMFSSDIKTNLENAFMQAYKANNTVNAGSVAFSQGLNPRDLEGKTDNFGRNLSEGQKEFFEGDKLVNEDGNLLRLFHTSGALFNKFDPRETDHYRFGDKIVNYFSTSEDVSGSYAEGVYSQITGEESYLNEENKGQRLTELRSQLEQVREEADLKGDEMRTQLRHILWDYDLNEISNRLKEATEISAENWLDEVKGFENYSLPFNVDRAIRSLGNEYNGAEYTTKRLIEIYDYVNGNEVTPEIRNLFSAINELNVPELKSTYERYESEINQLSDEELRLSNEISKLEDRGVQYVGYGLAKNPYVIENEHGNDRNNTVNWNSINNADWTISENDVGDLHNEIKNVFAKFKADGITADDMVGLDLVVQTKNKTNRFILENVNDETREFLIKNPIALANMTNAVQKSVDGAWTYQNFADNLDTNLDNYWGRADENGKYNYKYGGKLETNDVVKAVLAVNDFTDTPYDGVVFKNITDSASYIAFDTPSDVIALFASNQFKLLENENPTESEDVRFSKGMTLDEMREEALYNTGDEYVDLLMNDIIGSMSEEDFLEYLKTGEFEYATNREVEDDPKVQDEGLWVKGPEDNYIKIDDGYISNGKTVAWKDERIKGLVDAIETKNFSYFGGRYRNVYALNLSPHDFRSLSMIFDPINDEVWHNEINHDPYYNNGKVDPSRLGGSDPSREMSYQWIHASKDGNYSFKIDSTEGNHRAIILDESGYSKMPVLLLTDTPLDNVVRLVGMDGVKMDNPNRKIFELGDYIEVKRSNLNKLIEKFGSGANADIQYSKGITAEQLRISRDYNKAVNDDDMEVAQKLVRDYAQEYANKTGQQMFEGYHGTNARFNEFLKEKLGSKNVLAESAYMGFFMAGSEQTAENYTGINDGDFFKLMNNPGAEEIRKRVRDKYNYEELEEQDRARLNQYIENAWAQELASDSRYAQIYRRITDPELIKEVGLEDYADTMLETIRRQWQTDKVDGESRLNKLYDEYYNTEEHKRFAELRERASDELSKEYEELLGYEPNIKHLFAFMKNPLVHDFKREGRDVDFSELLREAHKAGNDGAVFYNVQDGGDFDTIYVVFEPNQFKLADPVTYDDNGNVIPLEKRFNQNTNDLRYSKGMNPQDLLADAEDYRATIAPYFDTRLNEDNRDELIKIAEKAYDGVAKEIADYLGIKLTPKAENIGGFENDEGKRLRELSWTYDLKGVDSDTARLFTSLMGDLAFENQEAVICMRYLSEDEGQHIAGEEGPDGGTYGKEYGFKCKDLKTVEEALKKADIANYNIDRKTNYLTVQDFGFDDDLPEKLDILLEGNNYETKEERPIYSYYLSREARQSLYEARGITEGGLQEGNQSGLSGRIQEANKRVTDVIEKKKSGSESPFLRRPEVSEYQRRVDSEGDLNMTDEELDKYQGIKTVETQKYGKKNIDKETGIYRPKAIIELDSTIGKTTHEEEIKDGEEYAGKFAQELDNGADVDDLLQKLMSNELQNGIVRAYYVSQVLADRDMQSEYMEVAQWARDIGNLGGKLVESNKILYDLDSTFARAVYLTKVEENLKDEYKQRLKGSKGAKVEQTISELFNKHANDIINSKTNREFRSAIGALAREVNRRMPKTIWDRITQYRMLAMLSGSKTAISNAVSNLASIGLYRMNGINQALLESALNDVTIKTIDDTKTYKINQEDRRATLKKDSKVSKKNKEIARKVWESLDKGNETKYGIEPDKVPDIIKNNLKTQNDTVRSKASKFVDMMFDTAQSVQATILSDAPFARMAFVQKLDELARARDINLETIDKKSKVYNKLIDDAFAYAEEVVSHNETDISKTIANITRASASNVRINEDSTLVGLDKMIKRFKERANNGEPIYRFIDGTVTKLQKWFIPFYKTNASIFQKSLQYSPLEWVQVANDWGKVKAGRMELVDMVDHMAKAVTGTELYLLGAIFGYLGWLKWEKDDEDYSGKLSVKVPGTDNGYTVDFIDPVSTIFAKGVVLAQEGSENGVSFKTFENLIHDYEDIFLSDELDMFSSMKDFFDTVGKVRKGEDDYGEYTLGDGATDIAFSVLNSYIPAIVRDVSRMIDPAKKVVYDTDNKKYLFNRLVNSTPFRSLLVNKKDSTGRTMNYTQPFTGNDVFDRLLTQMVSRGKLVDSKGQSITTRTGSPTMQESSSDAFSQMAQDFKYNDENGDGFSDAHWIRDSVPSNIYPGGNVTELTPEEKDEYGTTWTNVWNSGANYLVDNETYKGLNYENQADVIYELQGFARECIEADYCLDHNIEMTEAQRTAYEIRNFCTVDGKVDGKMLGLIALGTAKENKLASGGQRYVMAEQDENGKTIRNSRQLAMRHIYEEAGIYDQIVEAVQNSDGALTYADFGLGKTVVEKYSDDKADSSYQDIYGKVMKGSSKKKTKKKTGGSAGGITKAKGGGTLAKIKGPSAMASNPSRDTNIANNFFRAYANTFRRGSRETSSTSGGQVVCPRCGNRVYSRSGRCPICGASL